ncbi:MAG: helix-turn-helix transcriptional regulator, partial [Candidatus Aminicenantes bacterium]
MLKNQGKGGLIMSKEAMGKRLREIRRHFGYLQDKMAAVLGIKKVTYGKNERGLHYPDIFTLFALN